MVVPKKGVPALVHAQFRLPLVEYFFQLRNIELLGIVPFWLVFLEEKANVFKLKDHRQFLIVRTRVLLGNLRCRSPGLPNRQQILIPKGRSIHFLQIGMEHGTIGYDLLIWNLSNHIDDIHPKTTDPLVDPKIHHIVNLLPKGLIFPIQVRLLLAKEVQIILLRSWIKFPS